MLISHNLRRNAEGTLITLVYKVQFLCGPPEFLDGYKNMTDTTDQWLGGRGAGGGGHRPPSEDFLGALKFVIANVKYLTKYVKSSLSTDSKG